MSVQFSLALSLCARILWRFYPAISGGARFHGELGNASL